MKNDLLIIIKNFQVYETVAFNRDSKGNLLKENNIFDDIQQCKTTSKQQTVVVLDSFDGAIINKPEDGQYNRLWLDERNSLSVTKQEFKDIQKSYSSLKKPIIFSPYHILLELAKQKQSKYGLNCLIYEDHFYSMIIDNNSEVIYNDKRTLQNNQNQLLDQNIDELVTTIIEDILTKFYNKNSSFFIEYIDILNSANSGHQLYELNIADTLKIDTRVVTVNLHQTLYNIIDKKNSMNYYEKKERKFMGYKSFISLVILVPLVLFFLNYKGSITDFKFDRSWQNISMVKTITKFVDENIVKNLKNIDIPYSSYITKYTGNFFKTQVGVKSYNKIIKKRIKNHFDIIPDDITLQKFFLYKNGVKIYALMKHEESFSFILKNRLQERYKKTVTKKLKKQNEHFYILIKSTDKIAKSYYIKGKNRKLDQIKVENSIKKIVPASSELKLISKKEDHLKFYIKTDLKNPKQFYNLVDQLTKNRFAVDYPIVFKKIDDHIELKFFIKSYK